MEKFTEKITEEKQICLNIINFYIDYLYFKKGNYCTSRSRHTSSNSANSITNTTSSSKTHLSSNQDNELTDNNNSPSNNENKFLNSCINNNNNTNNNGFMNSPSLSHSYISNSVVTNSSASSTINNNNNNNNNNNIGYTRERSNTKSNHVQFLKLNEKNYLNGSSNLEDSDSLYSSPSNTNSSFSSKINNKKLTEPVSIKETTINNNNNKSKINNKTDNEPVNDLLFKPKTSTVYDSRIPAKSNEKLDLIQQQQREQMLLQSLSTTPNSSTNPSLNEIFSSTDNNNTVTSNTPTTTTTTATTNNSNNSEQMNDFNGADYNMEKQLKKLPFYAEPDTCIGFSWSWNFMLGRKWRSQFTGDELFQDNILADFRIFCSNKNGRLAKFYNECKDTLD